MNRMVHGWLCLVALTVQAEVHRSGEDWVLENRSIKVTVQDGTAWTSVLEKASGTLWRQEDPSRQGGGQDQVRVRRAAGPVQVDGDPGEWTAVPNESIVWLPWVGENGEANCSGGAKLMWDEAMLHLHVRVRDDVVAFGGETRTQWWEADSVEFWVDAVQVGLHLGPDGQAAAVNARGEAYAGSRVAVALISEGRLPGYQVEVSMPLAHFPVLQAPLPGVRFSFAIGINDADPAPGAPAKRDRQSYYPRSWVHSAPATFAVAALTDADGTAPERTRENDRSANATGGTIADMGPTLDGTGLTYRYLLRRGQTTDLPLRVTLALVGDAPQVDVLLDCLAGPETPMRAFDYPPALYPPQPGTFFMGVADYTNGRYLPVGDSYCRNRRFCQGGGDLPFVLVTDGTRGLNAILMTPWDGAVQMQTRSDDTEQLGFPAFHWQPQKGRWGDRRHGRLAFFAEGGHVAACKLYRDLASRQGLVRTFAEKEKNKPLVRRLFGAVNWWGAAGLPFVREALAAGMTRGLLNGRPNPADMAEIARLGWLVGEYDNYEDIDDSPTLSRAKAPVDSHAAVKEDGTFMTAWITRDKDMNPVHTFMKQCTAMMTTHARAVIPAVLDTYPFNTRFLDVTTATGLKECYSAVHPVTREEDQRHREALCAYVSNGLGLVAGGEHGRYWDVPYLDYHEGMMGGAMYSWPAGYLRDVTSREDLSANYLKYSIDPANRAPLFELVFHDCVVNYWYWGACNDYLHQVAPELTDRKTAMNVLYGTPPMMWANAHGLRWQIPAEREKMLEIYRNVCRLHEVIADQEMVSHAFLSEDRAVQRSTFADGTVATVNFGDAPHAVADAGVSRDAVVLRRDDFVVRGPRVEQWRLSSASEPSRIETYIRTATCLFADFGGAAFDVPAARGHGQLWVTLAAEDQARLMLGPGSRADLDLAAWQPSWRGLPVAVFETDAAGQPTRRIEPHADGRLTLAAPADAKALLLALVGAAARQPDVTLDEVRVTVGGAAVDPGAALAPGAVLDLGVTVRNVGLATAPEFAVVLRLDGAAGPVLARRVFTDFAAGASDAVSARLPAARADGLRRVVAMVESAAPVAVSGRLRRETAFVGPFREEAFPHRWSLQVSVPPGAAAGLPVEVPFAPGAADPANLRVRFADGAVLPAQYEPGAGNAADGTLVFVLPAGLPPGPSTATVFGAGTGGDAPFPCAARFEVASDGSQLRFDTYAARLQNGVLGDIAVRTPDGDLRVVSQIIMSSKETGWSAEEGTVSALTLRQHGPVRAVFTCSKAVGGTHNLEREWRFYGDRFEVHSRSTPPVGCLTRTFFAADGMASNETGATAAMDGRGDAEDFGFKGTPQWFAVHAEAWSTVCIALTRSTGFTYWDNGAHRGQIALNTGGEEREGRVFIWAAKPTDDAFARDAANAYAAGATAK